MNIARVMAGPADQGLMTAAVVLDSLIELVWIETEGEWDILDVAEDNLTKLRGRHRGGTKADFDDRHDRYEGDVYDASLR